MSTYPTYKPSGIEWLGDIPEHWEVNRLKNICTIGRGASPRPIADPKYFDDSGEYSWVRISDVSASNIHLEQTTEKLSTLGASLSVKVYPGDIFLSIAATVGKPIITSIKACIHDGFLLLAKPSINTKFYYYLLNCAGIYGGLGKMGTQLNLNSYIVGEVKFGVPSKNEQTAIANYLDEKTSKLDQLISNKKAQIDKLKEIRQIEINTAVTKGLDPNVKLKPSGIEWLGGIPEHWELKRFRYCFNNGKGLSITKENLKEKGIPCVNYGEIHSKYGFKVDPNRHPLLCVDEAYLETNPSSLLNYGNFVFADTSEDIEGAGNFTHLDSEQNIFAGYHTVISRLKIKSSPRFIAYCIDSLAYRTQIRSKVQGVKVYSITNKILKDTILWLPNSDEQTTIANYLDEKTTKLDQLVSNLENQIEQLQEVRKIEIYNAVTGKIKVLAA